MQCNLMRALTFYFAEGAVAEISLEAVVADFDW